MTRNQHFKSSMLAGKDKNDDIISQWCSAYPESKHLGFCLVCQQTIDVSKRGRCALVEHSNGKTNQRKSDKKRNSDGVLKPTEIQANRIDTFFRSASNNAAISHADAVTTAETIWCTAVAVCNLPIAAADKWFHHSRRCFQIRKSQHRWNVAAIKQQGYCLMVWDHISKAKLKMK